MVRRHALPLVERHPEQPHPQMGRGDRRGQRLPQAVELRQRQYPRPQGRLVTCEHGGRQVTRTEHDGTITVLCNRFDGVEGKPLNSPNDVVVKSDGSVWFTDPTFGIAGNYEGHKAEPELPMNVYRVDGRTGRATVVAENIAGPNGLCFSPDEKLLYLVESRAQPRNIKVFDVVDDGDALANPRDFADLDGGTPDGFRCDVRRQSVVRLGHEPGAQWRRGVRSRRQDDRPHRAARTLRQSLFRRRQAQPPVHGGEPFALFGLREHPRRDRRISVVHRPEAAPAGPFAAVGPRHADWDQPLEKDRLLAFSDGVIAIIITIMVLELKVPHGADLGGAAAALPVFLSYVLSFVYVGIYWNNHHHLLHATERVNGAILWANLHLLFWLSLIPFATGWMGENHFAPLPTALYGVVLLMPASPSSCCRRRSSARRAATRRWRARRAGPQGQAVAGALPDGDRPRVRRRRGSRRTIYVAVALMWLIPDRRIERALAQGRR